MLLIVVFRWEQATLLYRLGLSIYQWRSLYRALCASGILRFVITKEGVVLYFANVNDLVDNLTRDLLPCSLGFPQVLQVSLQTFLIHYRNLFGADRSLVNVRGWNLLLLIEGALSIAAHVVSILLLG